MTDEWGRDVPAGFRELPTEEELGLYRLFAESCERGGSGARVFLAESESVTEGHPVVVKVLKRGVSTGGEEAVHRFRRETCLPASIAHENLVKVLDSGETDDCLFLVTEFLPGPSITEYGRSLPVREKVDLVARAASGVAFLQDRGVIHRDLKPGNILMSEGGEPKILDFGLAKYLAEGGSETLRETLTISGEQLGTLHYMSPEQAAGESATVSASADVYALGVILFELLTGRLPHERRDGENPQVTLARAAQKDAPSVRSIEKGISLGLSAVVDKALARDPDRRYPNAEAFRRELERFLEGDRVEARPISMSQRIVRMVLRNRVAAGAIAIVLMVLVGAVIVVAVLESQRAEREAGLRLKAEDSEAIARRVSSRTDTILGAEYIQKGELDRGLAVLARALRVDPKNSVAQRIAAQCLMYSPLALRERVSSSLPLSAEGRVRILISSPGGELFAVINGSPQIVVLSAAGERMMRDLGSRASSGIVYGAFTEGGTRFVGACQDGRVLVWRTIDWKLETEIATGFEQLTSVVVSPDGSRLVALQKPGDGKTQQLFAAYDLPEGKQISSKEGVSLRMEAGVVAMARDAESLIVTNRTKKVQVFDLETGRERRGPPKLKGEINKAALHPTKPWAVFAGQWSQYQGWDLLREEPLFEVLEHRELGYTTQLTDVSFSESGQHFVVASHDGTARVYVSETGQPAGGYLEHAASLQIARFCSEDVILTVERSGRATLWDWKAGQRLGRAPRLSTLVSQSGQLAVIPNSNRWLWLEDSGNVSWWRLFPGREPLQRWAGPVGNIGAAVSSDGSAVLISRRGSGEAQAFDTKSGRAVTRKLPHKVIKSKAGSRPGRFAERAQLSSDRDWIVTIASEKEALLWSLHADREPVLRITLPSAPTRWRFSGDGRWLVIGCTLGHVVVVDVAERLIRTTLEDLCHPHDRVGTEVSHGVVTALSFSPDSQWLVAASQDWCTYGLWKVDEWRRVGTLPTLGHRTAEIAFDPKMRSLWLAKWSNEARGGPFDRTKPGGQLHVSARHAGPVYSVEFSPDGSFLATAGGDGAAVIRDPVTAEPRLPRLRHPISRGLSKREGSSAGVEILDLSVSPDGSVLATAGSDRAVWLWSTDTLRPLGPPLIHPQAVTQVELLDGDRRLLTTSNDGVVRIWEISRPSAESVSPYWPQLLEGLGGLRLDETGAETPVSTTGVLSVEGVRKAAEGFDEAELSFILSRIAE